MYNTYCNPQHSQNPKHIEKNKTYTRRMALSKHWGHTARARKKLIEKIFAVIKGISPTQIFSTPSRNIKMHELGNKDGRGKTLKQNTFFSRNWNFSLKV